MGRKDDAWIQKAYDTEAKRQKSMTRLCRIVRCGTPRQGGSEMWSIGYKVVCAQVKH
jgi:hypothetical protein